MTMLASDCTQLEGDAEPEHGTTHVQEVEHTGTMQPKAVNNAELVEQVPRHRLQRPGAAEPRHGEYVKAHPAVRLRDDASVNGGSVGTVKTTRKARDKRSGCSHSASPCQARHAALGSPAAEPPVGQGNRIDVCGVLKL